MFCRFTLAKIVDAFTWKYEDRYPRVANWVYDHLESWGFSQWDLAPAEQPASIIEGPGAWALSRLVPAPLEALEWLDIHLLGCRARWFCQAIQFPAWLVAQRKLEAEDARRAKTS